jgi:Tfp pilus assembly protein PilV
MTLIELLAASLILAVAMMGLSVLFLFSWTSTQRNDEQAVAFTLGRMAVERARALGWMYRADTAGSTYYKSDNTTTGIVQLAGAAGAAFRVDVAYDDQNAGAERNIFTRVGVQVVRLSDNAVLYSTRIGLTVGGS